MVLLGHIGNQNQLLIRQNEKFIALKLKQLDSEGKGMRRKFRVFKKTKRRSRKRKK